MYPAHQARQKIGELIVVGFSPPGLTRAHHRAYLCLLSDGENIFGTRPFEARRKENKCVLFPSQTYRVRNIMWGSKTSQHKQLTAIPHWIVLDARLNSPKKIGKRPFL